MKYYFRFGLLHRLMHALMMVTFLGLAATGLPIKFSQSAWAGTIAQTVGGFVTLIFFHKLCGLLLSLAFAGHVGHLIWRALVAREPGILWGPNSMVPRPKDGSDIFRHFLWFFGMGKKPAFDRFTYWEKFDYWAVFWGMAIIGSSGFMLWFSGFFARFLPGWLFNVALVIHSEEALLAVCFIFVIHFFNSHLRPEKFPMDLVIFTGRVSEEELRRERPLEYERLVRTGRLAEIRADPPPLWLLNLGRIAGGVAVFVGLSLFVLVLFAF